MLSVLLLSLIILLKISSLAQGVSASEILRRFPKLTPLTQGLFMIRPYRIKLFYKENVSHMISAKDQLNRSIGSGEEVVRMFF